MMKMYGKKVGRYTRTKYRGLKKIRENKRGKVRRKSRGDQDGKVENNKRSEKYCCLRKKLEKVWGEKQGALSKRVNTCISNKKFSEKFFFFFGQSIFDTNLFEKRSLFFLFFGKNRRFCCVRSFSKILVQMFNFANIFKSLTEFSTNKKSTQITNNYFVERCMKNNYFSITNITRWVGFQKKLNC